MVGNRRLAGTWRRRDPRLDRSPWARHVDPFHLRLCELALPRRPERGVRSESALFGRHLEIDRHHLHRPPRQGAQRDDAARLVIAGGGDTRARASWHRPTARIRRVRSGSAPRPALPCVDRSPTVPAGCGRGRSGRQRSCGRRAIPVRTDHSTIQPWRSESAQLPIGRSSSGPSAIGGREPSARSEQQAGAEVVEWGGRQQTDRSQPTTVRRERGAARSPWGVEQQPWSRPFRSQAGVDVDRPDHRTRMQIRLGPLIGDERNGSGVGVPCDPAHSPVARCHLTRRRTPRARSSTNRCDQWSR